MVNPATMTPLERAAQALQKEADRLFEEKTSPEFRDFMAGREGAGWTTLVRAVLQSIREPSEGMLGACDNIGMEAEAENPNRAALFWQRMIDAALEEGA
jgi:hypothetical protein